MARESLLQQAFAETGVQLDRIIDAYNRVVPEPPRDPTKTYGWYSNGDIVEYDLSDTINYGDIERDDLIRLDIGSNVSKIGEHGLGDCTNLREVNFPDNMEIIGNDAFASCTSLSSVVLSSYYINEIGYSAFWRCTNLKSVVIGSDATAHGLFYLGNMCFHKCPNLSSITCIKYQAPDVQSITFGDEGGIDASYTGYNSRSSGNNVLRIPQGATGYNLSYWLDPLQNAEKCGFHIEYI